MTIKSMNFLKNKNKNIFNSKPIPPELSVRWEKTKRPKWLWFKGTYLYSPEGRKTRETCEVSGYLEFHMDSAVRVADLRFPEYDMNHPDFFVDDCLVNGIKEILLKISLSTIYPDVDSESQV